MICGLGTDIVEITRIKRSIERFGMRFVKKILTSQEIVQLQERKSLSAQNISTHSLAARFAAKEAAVKALGTGFSNGIGLHDVCILNTENGAPQLFFHGKALERFIALGASTSHISISHGRDVACATVILEK